MPGVLYFTKYWLLTVFCLFGAFPKALTDGDDVKEKHADQPVVKTQFGVLKGLYGHSETHKIKFSKFLGIPYALPPINQLRFQPPQPNNNFYSPNKPLEAIQFPSECPQHHIMSKEFKGSEDCLYLNVFTPELEFKSDSLYPVMVWIHGGYFLSGSASPQDYGPERFMDHEIVMVTINYRLGVLGFLTTGDEQAPPNVGMMDQQLALTWIKENIRQFGGDPARVTIMGESAGGASVVAHMASPRAQGLFQQAISMSGVWGTHPFLHKSRPLAHYSSLLAIELDCKASAGSESMIKCLQTKPASELVAKAGAMFDRHAHLPLIFTPVVDADMPDPVLPKPRLNPWKKEEGRSSSIGADIPIMIGGNRDEGLISLFAFFQDEELFKVVDGDYATEGPVLLLGTDVDIASTDEGESATAQVLRHFYLKDANFSVGMLPQIRDMLTDAHFLGHIDLTVRQMALARAKSKNGGAPIYYYNYQHEGSFTLPMAIGVMDFKGVCHADELFLMFTNAQVSGHWMGDIALQTEEDIIVSKKLVEMWTNFAKTGNPTPTDNAWKPLSAPALTENVSEEEEIRNYLPSYAVINSNQVYMDYPENFGERMKTVQNMIHLMDRHRNFNLSEHPALKQMEMDKKKYFEEEMRAEKPADWGIKEDGEDSETSKDDLSDSEEDFDFEAEMRKLLEEEEEVGRQIRQAQRDEL